MFTCQWVLTSKPVWITLMKMEICSAMRNELETVRAADQVNLINWIGFGGNTFNEYTTKYGHLHNLMRCNAVSQTHQSVRLSIWTDNHGIVQFATLTCFGSIKVHRYTTWCCNTFWLQRCRILGHSLNLENIRQVRMRRLNMVVEHVGQIHHREGDSPRFREVCRIFWFCRLYTWNRR